LPFQSRFFVLQQIYSFKGEICIMKKRLVIYFAIAITIFSTVVAGTGISFAQPPGGGWWTSFTLQNPTNATVNVGLIDAKVVEGSPTTGDKASSGSCPILPGRSVIFNPGQAPNYKADGSGGIRIGIGDKCESGELSSNFQGSVVISSDGQLAAVVSLGNNKNGSVGIDGGKASAFYQGVSRTSKTLNFPVAKNNFFGQTTTYAIQAVQNASVTVTFTGIANCSVGPVTISAGRARIITMPSCVDSSKSYAAIATSTTGDIVGAVTEHPHSESPASFALSTRAFTPADADTTVYAPVLKNDFFGGTTGLAVQNVGPGAATFEVDFAITNSQPGASCSAATSTAITLQEGTSEIFGGSADRNLPAGFGNGCFGAGTIRRTSGTGRLVATVNETSGQGKATYSAFGAAGATTKVAVPLVKEEFFGGRTAVTVQAVGTGTTSITAQYKNDGACAAGCSITPNGGGAGPASISGGQANNFRRLNNFSTEYNGTKPATNTNNAVVLTSSALPIVAVAQESAVTAGTLDVKNYEGFAQ
jgi:hypothetical protein